MTARTPLLILLGAAALLSGCSRVTAPAGVTPVERAMLITGYCKCGQCCGWKRNWYFRPVHASGPLKGRPKQVGMTASGEEARRGTIAADTARYPFGTVMYIEGYGYGRVEDRGGAIQGDHIDLFFSSHSSAQLWGSRRCKVSVWYASQR